MFGSSSERKVKRRGDLVSRRQTVPLLFLQHLLINNDLPPNAPLFAYKSMNGTWNPLSKDVFLTFVNRTWSNAHLYHVFGHSFRIGGAVALLLAGVPPEVVAATGGWTSLSFLLYWRRLEHILPKSTSQAYNSSDLNFLFTAFEKFRMRWPTALVF